MARELDLNVDDLATFIFRENPSDRPFDLALVGIETSKELFFFMLDMLCKGLVLLFGDGSTSVDLAQVTHEQFLEACRKLACAGIRVTLDTQPKSEAAEDGAAARVNMPQLTVMPDDAPLEAFVLRMRVAGLEHAITFALTRAP